MERKKSKKPIVIAVIIITLLLGGAGAAGTYWYLYEHSGSETMVARDVYVNDVAIGDMRMDDAWQEIEKIEEEMSSQVKVDVTAGENAYHFDKEDFPCSFDSEEVFAAIKDFSAEKGFDKPERRFEITMTTDTSGIDGIVEKIAEEAYVKPVNAKVKKYKPSADDPFSFREEKDGQKLDKDDLTEKLTAVFKDGGLSGSVEAKIDPIAPKMTVEYLRSHIVKLSSFSTVSTNNANGNENMRVSLKACNGSIIDPGKTWSFNECTGDSNLASNGYKPAGVLIRGRSETGIGGGICQSSTTIYNAGLLCGMEVEERYCHYYKSTYVDAGRDATIDYGNLDLKLSNPFDYQLFMKCRMDGTKLTCEIYGFENPEFDSVKISTSKPSYNKKSYTVKAWRTFYLGGETVRKEELPESTYYTSAP